MLKHCYKELHCQNLVVMMKYVTLNTVQGVFCLTDEDTYHNIASFSVSFYVNINNLPPGK